MIFLPSFKPGLCFSLRLHLGSWKGLCVTWLRLEDERWERKNKSHKLSILIWLLTKAPAFLGGKKRIISLMSVKWTGEIDVYSVELNRSWQLNNFSLEQWMINPASYKFCSNADLKKDNSRLKTEQRCTIWAVAQSLDVYLVSASSVRGFLSNLKSLLLPGNLNRTWKAISLLKGFSPQHSTQAVVML